MYSQVEQFETVERRVTQEVQLREERGAPRRSSMGPRRQRMPALRAGPKGVVKAGCIAEPECC